jgi:hypothetical protein
MDAQNVGLYIQWNVIQPQKGRESQMWWFMPIIPEFGRQKQEDHEFKASLSYTERPYFKKKRKGREGNSDTCYNMDDF